MAWPKATELAILTVNGQKYQDWETVSVKHELKQEPFYTFRFTCSEGMPLVKNWAAMRIRPGDHCTITLAGESAFSGLVHTRQVFYDAHRHYIEIQGASQVLALSHGSPVHKSYEENNIPLQQYISKITGPFGINFKVEGGSLPSTPIPRMSFFGMTAMEAIQIPARALGHINFTSNVQGDLVAIVGPTGGSDTVVEGKDILEGREIIYNPGMASGTYVLGPKPGGDKESGAKVTHIPFDAGVGGSAIKAFVKQLIPLEIPTWSKQFMQGRNLADNAWQNEDWMTVYVTIHGWLRPSGGLWVRGQAVSVMSPMLIMDGDEGLKLKSATFTQDNQRGTRTVLELMNDKAMEAFAPGGPGAN